MSLAVGVSLSAPYVGKWAIWIYRSIKGNKVQEIKKSEKEASSKMTCDFFSIIFCKKSFQMYSIAYSAKILSCTTGNWESR